MLGNLLRPKGFIEPINDQVSITLSNNLSVRVRHLDQQCDEDIITVVEQLLEDALPATIIVY